MVMRQNSGEAFFHPVTHQLIEKGVFYQGSAHLEHETAAEIEELENNKEESQENTKPDKNKSSSNKSDDK